MPSRANQVCYAPFTTVRGDVDGDGAADFIIKIDGDVDKFDNFIF